MSYKEKLKAKQGRAGHIQKRIYQMAKMVQIEGSAWELKPRAKPDRQESGEV